MPKDIPSQDDRRSTMLGGCLDELSGHVNSWLDEFRSRAGILSRALERTREQVQTLETTEVPSDEGLLHPLAAMARNVECTSDQAQMLDLLLSGTAAYAPRCVLFVARPDAFSGWAARGIEAEPKSLGVAAQADTILKRVLTRCEPCREACDARPGNRSLLQPLGSETPREMAAAPIWVKDKVVGILYADSGRGGSEWHPEGIFLAASLVALGLEALPLRARNPRPIPPPEPVQEESPFAVSHGVEDESPEIEVIGMVDAEDEPEIAMAADPLPAPSAANPTESQTESELIEPDLDLVDVESSEAETDPIEPDPDLIDPDSELIGFEEQPIADLEPELIEPEPGMVAQAAASQTVEMSTAAAAPAPQAADDPRHGEAKKFARLLVSEILLYNEKQVQEGRLKKDLYERLREDIERSRQMYDERITTRLPDAAGYFREELINSIADGDESAMKIPWG